MGANFEFLESRTLCKINPFKTDQQFVQVQVIKHCPSIRQTLRKNPSFHQIEPFFVPFPLDMPILPGGYLCDPKVEEYARKAVFVLL